MISIISKYEFYLHPLSNNISLTVNSQVKSIACVSNSEITILLFYGKYLENGHFGVIVCK